MFGMSVFQSVLERLKAEEDAGTQTEEAAPPSVRGLAPGFVPSTGQNTSATPALVHRAYIDTAGDDIPAAPAAPAKPVMPDHLTRTRPQDIAADLALTDRETPTSLTARRRAFAALNHPDLYDPDFRANATIRMKIANMLIDEAIRRVNVMQRL